MAAQVVSARLCRMATLEEEVLEIVRSLARVNPLTPEAIAKSKDVRRLSTWSWNLTLKAILQAAKNLHMRGQFGKLRAALLIGTTLFGDPFLLQVERAGIFLGDRAQEESFGRFLNQLTVETANTSSPSWTIFHDRLKTYLAYQTLLEAISKRSSDISSFLGTRPRPAVRMALVLTALSFLRRDFEFQMPPEFSKLIDELGSPEETASITSLLVVLANEYYPLDSYDFAFPDLVGGPGVGELRELMIHVKAMVQQFEVAKYVSLFRYDLETVSAPNPTFYLRPPSADFEYSLRLGFIRSEMNAGMARVDVAAKVKASTLSLQGAAERFAKTFRAKLGEIRDEKTEWRRLRLHFPIIPDIYNTIKNSVFYEDFLSDEQLAQDFLIPLRRMREAEIKLTEHLDLKTFHGAWRYFQFLGLVDIALLRGYSKSDPTILLNSLVRAASEESMVEFVEGLGISKEQARDFLDVVSADVRDLGYFDLQYWPFLRIAQTLIPKEHALTKPEIIHLPALVCSSNVLRNVQSANKFRVQLNASIFVDVTARTFSRRFAKVQTNKPVKGRGATDIDVIVFEGNTLYLFECKHSLPPTGPHELRDIWEEIEDGARQLETAMRILGDPARRQSYLTGWFPGTRSQDTVDLRIVACVLCSHGIFSGLQYKGFPIRDFGSLALLCGDGVVGMGGMIAEDEVILRQYRIIRDKTISGLDLDDYLSPDSTYFKSLRPFMHPVTRIERLGEMTIAKETYVYEMELDEWVSQMESLGCTREPDRRQKLKPVFTGEILRPEDSS